MRGVIVALVVKVRVSYILSGMNENILSAIDAEIARLQEARAILASMSIQSTAITKPKRTMSASARKRIAAAQRKRWAALKKAKRG